MPLLELSDAELSTAATACRAMAYQKGSGRLRWAIPICGDRSRIQRSASRALPPGLRQPERSRP